MTATAIEYGPDQPRPWDPDHPSLHNPKTAAHEPGGVARTMSAHRLTRADSADNASVIRDVAELLRYPAAWVKSAESEAREAAKDAALTGAGVIHGTPPADWADYS